MKDTKFTKFVHPIKKEFTWNKLHLRHKPNADFMRSQWQQQTRSILYLLYRWAIALFFIVVVIVTMVKLFMNGRYFIYLTHWGILLCMVTNVYGAILVTIWHCNRKNIDESLQNNDEESEIPLSIKIYWILHMTTLNVALVITFVYWSFLYQFQRQAESEGKLILNMPLNVLEHAMNSVLMVIDVMIVAFPIRVLHIVFPICLGLIYGIFSLIYYLAGGVDFLGRRFIYPILDWSKPGLAIGTVFGTLVLFIIFSFVSFFLYKLRIIIYRKYHQSKMSTFNDI